VVLLLKFVALVTLLEADAGPLLPVPWARRCRTILALH
jgi:hypothetical protein